VRRFLTIVCVAGLLSGVVACSPDGDDPAPTTDATESTDTTTTTTTTSTSMAPSTPSAPPTSTGPAADEATTDPKEGPAVGDGVALLTDVRAARNAGFDRLVFEFAGDDLPQWRVQYAEGPFTEDGSGNPVEVEGDFFLEVHMEGGTGFDGETGQETYTGPAAVPGRGTVRVVEVVRTGDFEAVMNWIVGTNRGVPFRVTTLTEPSRLVIDLAQQE